MDRERYRRSIRFTGNKESYNREIKNINTNDNMNSYNVQIENLITYDLLGKNGRLGNQLFQIAATIGAAKRNEMNAIFPKWFCKYTNKDFSTFFEVPLNQATQIYAPNIYKEPSFSYNKIPNIKGLCLRGYYQSEKYFEDCKDEIRYYFTPKKSILDSLKNKYNKELSGNTCCVHIRRGDYVNNPLHNVCNIDYYNNSIEYIKSVTDIDRFLFFSDDINWCKESFIGDNFYFIEGNQDIEDLFVMSECKNHIISNSSFSWWGSWLCNNENKIIIAPDRWFTEESRVDYKNIYTSNMIRL